MHVEKKVDSNGFIVCKFATPIRQKDWHSPMVEDAEGRSLFLAISVEVAQQIVTAINQSTPTQSHEHPSTFAAS